MAMVAGLALAAPASAAPVAGDPIFRGQPALGKVSRSLLDPEAAAAGGGAEFSRATTAPELDIRLSALTGEVLARAVDAGLVVLDADFRHARILGTCSGDCLPALAALPEVTAIHPNYGAATMAGNVISQADISIRARDAREVHGIDGSGIRVGVLSDTLTSRTQGNTEGSGCSRTFVSTNPISAAELPAVIYNIAEPRDLPGSGSFSGTDEGRAMIELIHDLAPGADIFFHTAFTTPSVFARGIEELVGCGADIIVDDVIYFLEPMFQDGIIAQAAIAAIDQGVLFFSAIGNLGPWGVDEVYTDFSPVDDMSATPSGNDLHVFSSGSRFARVSVPRGCGLRMVMQWNETFSGTLGPGATTDLDLYACTSADPASCSANAASRDAQGCSTHGGGPSGDPVEILDVSNFGGGNQGNRVAYIAVEHVCGNKDVRFRIAGFALSCFFPNRFEFDPAVFRSSPAYGHPVAEGVISTAAVFYQEIDSGGETEPPPDVINVEPFSSLGGDIPYYFDTIGQPVANGPRLVRAPVLSAPDGTNTSFFGHRDAEGDGFPNFFGTSAAAPHAAAVAALILEADPSLSAAEVLDILRSTAIDIEEPGPDFRSGSGLIDALDAVDEVFRRQSPSPAATATQPLTAAPSPTPTRAAGCPGDCDGDGVVTIAELVLGVRIALGELDASDCPSLEITGNGAVSIDELMQALRAALFGC